MDSSPYEIFALAHTPFSADPVGGSGSPEQLFPTGSSGGSVTRRRSTRASAVAGSPARPPSSASHASGLSHNSAYLGVVGRASSLQYGQNAAAVSPSPTAGVGGHLRDPFHMSSSGSIGPSNSHGLNGNGAISSPPSLQHGPRTHVSSTASGPISSPFLLDYAMPAVSIGAVLTAEQQQRLYEDFVAGKHLNSFNATLPPEMQMQIDPFPTAEPAASSSAAAASSSAALDSLRYAPSNPLSGGISIGGSSASASSGGDSEEDEDAQEARTRRPRGKRGGGRGIKVESTPASAAANAPYARGGGSASAAANDAAYDLGDPTDKDDKNRLGKRLARKAELARASRRRKKMYVQDLESKVKKLTAKVDELQAKASTNRSKMPVNLLADEDAQRKTAQQQIRATMSAILSQPDGGDAAQTQRILHDLVRQFVENSRDRQAQVETYLDRVEDCLTPGLQAKFAMWGLDQKEDFYSKPGLWTSLMSKEIGLTPTQLANLLSKRPAIHKERKNLVQCEKMIKDLRQAAGQHLRSLHQTMDEIQTAMTPTQLAKFYLWVENNEWTMQILDPVLGFSTRFPNSRPAAQQ